MKNMMEMMNIMKKAQAVQSQAAALQNKLENTNFTGEASKGAVKITVTGKFKPVKVELDKSVVDPADVETLEDLILVAMADAKEKADAAMDAGMESMKSNLGLPENFKLPF